MAIVVHIPLFHPNYFGVDESIYWLCAKKIVQGGSMYVDAWDNKPPLIFWFYTLWVWFFDEYALWALRFFSIGYAFICSILLNQLFYFYKFSKNFHIWPAILLCTYIVVPWYASELNAEHLMLLPTLLMLIYACFYFVEGIHKWSYLYWIGVLGAICMGFKYQGLLNLIGLLMGIFFFHTFRPHELLLIGLGFTTVLLVSFLALYFTDSLQAFGDIGVLFNLDYLRVGKNLGEEVSFVNGLFEQFKVFGVVIVFGFLGISYFRQKFYSQSIRLRRVETLLFSLSISGIIAILLGGGRMYLHYFVQVLPFLIIYAVAWALQRRYGNLLLSLHFIFPIFSFAMYFFVSTPERFAMIKPYVKTNGWMQSQFNTLHFSEDEKRILQDTQNIKDILIIDFSPNLYLKWKKNCATKYVNFSLAFYKMNWLEHHKNKLFLISKPESLANLYKELKKQMPRYVIDYQGIFKEWKEQIPLLLMNYQYKKIGKFDIYYLPDDLSRGMMP